MDTPEHLDTLDSPFLVSLNQKMTTYTVILTVVRLCDNPDPDMPPIYRTGETAFTVDGASPEAAVHEAMRKVTANRELPPLMSMRLTCCLLGACEVVPRSSINVEGVAAALDYIETTPGEDWFDSPMYQAIVDDEQE